MTTESKLSFVYQASPVRAVFGIGAIEKAPEEIGRLGAERV